MQRRRMLALGRTTFLTALGGCVVPTSPGNDDGDPGTPSATPEGVPVSVVDRADQFHHVASTNDQLYLHPPGDEARTGPVEPGCWRLTEPVAIPEYYGIIEVEAGETRRAESLVYGHPGLPEGECLPAGEHRITARGVAGDDPDAIGNEERTTEFSWGFTLAVEETA
jgi:hypothetical protein